MPHRKKFYTVRYRDINGNARQKILHIKEDADRFRAVFDIDVEMSETKKGN